MLTDCFREKEYRWGHEEEMRQGRHWTYKQHERTHNWRWPLQLTNNPQPPWRSSLRHRATTECPVSYTRDSPMSRGTTLL